MKATTRLIHPTAIHLPVELAGTILTVFPY